MNIPAEHQSAWQRFWERGGWWRALLLVVVYFALYELLPLAFVGLADAVGDTSTPGGVLVDYALPILIGSLLLIGFIVSVRWTRQVFGSQPIRGSGWMWIAVGVVLIFNVLHLFSIDYGAAGIQMVGTWLLTGLLIGFAEEVLTRGLVITLLRKAGYREIVVALISAGLFALMHSGNLLVGQSLLATGIQILYTFAFGICMYLALRVTGTIIAPILLHASTDPTIFLQVEYPTEGAIGAFANLGNFAVIAAGFVLIFFVRGRVADRGATMA